MFLGRLIPRFSSFLLRGLFHPYLFLVRQEENIPWKITDMSYCCVWIHVLLHRLYKARHLWTVVPGVRTRSSPGDLDPCAPEDIWNWDKRYFVKNSIKYVLPQSSDHQLSLTRLPQLILIIIMWLLNVYNQPFETMIHLVCQNPTAFKSICMTALSLKPVMFEG